MTQNLRWGAKWGVLGGVAVGCWAGVILLLKDELPEVNLLLLVLSYPIIGLVGGLLVGIARPVMTTRRSATLIGAAVGVVLTSLLMPFAIGLPNTWDFGEIFGIVVTGVLLGGFAGHQWWVLNGR